MSSPLQPAPLVFSTAFGLLMAAAASVRADRLGSIATALAVIAVIVGLRYRSAAILSVLFVIVAVVLSDPPALFAALSGLSAAAYLVIRYAAGPWAGIVTTTRPTVIAMVGFTVVGIVATVVPLSLPWLPLVAPPAVVVIFALATLPLLRGEGTDPRDRSGVHAG